MNKRENAFHEEIRKEQRKRRFTIIGVVCILIIFCAGLVYLIFFSSFFSIKHIRLQQPHSYISSQLSAYVSKSLGKNILFYTLSRKAIQNHFPILSYVKIQKIYPQTLQVQVKLYPASMLLQTPSITYVISENGIIMAMISNASGQYHLPLVVSNENGVSQIQLPNLSQAIVQIESNKNAFISDFSFTPPYDITASYANGQKVIFSLHKSISTQLNQVDQVQSDMSKDSCPVLDVRFANVYCGS